MTKRSNVKSKLNNEGFSLVEVLVAVIIIALVAGPLLAVFVMSARFNKASRTNQDVNIVAESFMEKFKGADIKNITSVPSSYGFDGASTDEAGTISFVAKNHTFISNKYDIRVLATPRAESFVVDIEPISEETDFVFVQDLNYDQACYEYIANSEVYPYWDSIAGFEADYPAMTEADKLNLLSVTRRININVTQNADSSKTVTVTYDYDYSVGEKTYTNPVTNEFKTIPEKTGTVSSSVSWAPKPGSNYTKTFPASKPLNRIYLCYSPAYETASEARIKSDSISITGIGANHKTYILKQMNPYLSGNLSFMEANYTVSVNGSNYYHNFDINMNTGAYDTALAAKPFAIADKSLYLHPLDDVVENKKLIYDLQVEVYENGAYGSFPASKLLYTLNGSMNAK